MHIKSAACALALFISGCAVHPLPDDVSRKSTVGIVEAIRCEAGQAVREFDERREFDRAVIGFAFIFDVTEKNGASADFSLTRGFLGGSVGLGLSGGGVSLTREAKRTFTIIDSFEELRALQCGQQRSGVSPIYPVSGSIGVGEIISTFIRLENLKPVKLTEKLDASGKIDGETIAFSDELSFKTMLTAPGIKHTMAFDAVPGVLRLTSANTMTSADRTDDHQLTLALALPSLPPGPPPGSPKAATAKQQSRNEIRDAPFSTASGSRVPSKPQIDAATEARTKVLYTLERRRIFANDLETSLLRRAR
jgi:hypothetical protein